MYMDGKHPVSRFILEAENLEESVSDLLRNPKKPKGVSLVVEYGMFYETDLAIYDLHVDFGDLVNSKSTAMYDIADLLQVDSHDVRSSVLSALSAETPTKNHGRVALFQELDEEFVTVLEARVREILQNRVPDVVRR